MNRHPAIRSKKDKIRVIQPGDFARRALERRFADGKALELQGRFADAEKVYRELVASFERQRINSGTPCAALAYTLVCQAKWEEAERILKRSIKLEPKILESHVNLGAVYRHTRRWQECHDASKRALELEPKDTRARLNLGVAFAEMSQYGAAVQAFLLVLALDPDHLEARKGIASNYVSLGEPAVSIPMFRRVIEMEPDVLSNYSQILFAMQYEPTLSNEAVLEEHLNFGRKTRTLIGSPGEALPIVKHWDRILRIGYVSGDYRTHVVMRFIENVIASHDRDRVEVVCISTTNIQDATTERIKKLAGGWLDISAVDDETAVRMIRDKQLDIAVDLSGHSSILRLGLFARRLAPVHLSWCGYSGTTGLDTMDYIVVDNIISPPGEKTFFVERPIRMPGSYVCFSPSDAPAIGPLPFDHNGHITFGCMNNPGKVNKYVIAWWAQILNAVPNSRLLMRYHLLDDPLVKERLNKIFRSQGIADRVDMRSGGGSFLDSYNAVDIALDTFPYNGTTTTCEALWMGVPVISMRGDRFVARVGASLLTNVGLETLVGENPQDYIDRAVALAQQPDRLAGMRKTMRANLVNTVLYDPATFTRQLEDKYSEVFQEWCER
ncbi:MAG TPA: tetratricopeptide repeat protein [Bryobacteraceae bacterium]|jgi:predicted O-linked N-acetylglucosamine transferase (SPINDLY family)|nr:tetratricopeptide repeat protein [Bryobacteraceae bacterium]